MKHFIQYCKIWRNECNKLFYVAYSEVCWSLLIRIKIQFICTNYVYSLKTGNITTNTLHVFLKINEVLNLNCIKIIREQLLSTSPCYCRLNSTLIYWWKWENGMIKEFCMWWRTDNESSAFCACGTPQGHALLSPSQLKHWPFLTEGRGLSLARWMSACLIASRHRPQCKPHGRKAAQPACET